MVQIRAQAVGRVQPGGLEGTCLRRGIRCNAICFLPLSRAFCYFYNCIRGKLYVGLRIEKHVKSILMIT